MNHGARFPLSTTMGAGASALAVLGDTVTEAECRALGAHNNLTGERFDKWVAKIGTWPVPLATIHALFIDIVAGSGPICAKNHVMAPSNFSSGAYSGGWNCDKCGTGHPKTTFRWFCPTCQSDICFECHAPKPAAGDARPSGLCPKGHGLSLGVTPKPNYRCDDCQKVLQKGAEIASCRPCNYDRCNDCALARVNSALSTSQLGARPGGNAADIVDGSDSFRGQTCRNQHALVTSKTPKPNYGCDDCKSVLPQGSLVGSCRQCNYDRCLKCAKAGGLFKGKLFRKQHALVPTRTPKPNYRCDECKKVLAQGSLVGSCRSCNYDCCETCVKSGNTGSQTQPSTNQPQKQQQRTSAAPASAPAPAPAKQYSSPSASKPALAVGAIDTGQFVSCKSSNLDGVKMGQISDLRYHALHMNESRYHDEMLLGMRGMTMAGFSSGDKVVSKTGRKGKLSIAVGSGSDKKFLCYWEGGEQGYVYPKDLQPKKKPEDGGWNQQNIDKVCSEIRAVEAKGGLKQMLGRDGKMRSFVTAVAGNAMISDAVYDAVGSSVENDPCYPEFLALSDAVQLHLVGSNRGHKPMQASLFADKPLLLHSDAKKTKPKFDAVVKKFATATGGKYSLAGVSEPTEVVKRSYSTTVATGVF